jgi:hypothetical protein
LHEGADLIRAGLALFPDGRLPDDPDDASVLVDRLPEAAGEKLEELGNRYYEAVPRLDEAFRSYLAAHPEQFPGPLSPGP